MYEVIVIKFVCIDRKRFPASAGNRREYNLRKSLSFYSKSFIAVFRYFERIIFYLPKTGRFLVFLLIIHEHRQNLYLNYWKGLQ